MARGLQHARRGGTIELGNDREQQLHAVTAHAEESGLLDATRIDIDPGGPITLAQFRTYIAYRTSVGADLPEGFGDLVAAVTAFADPLVDPERNNTTWHATDRRWTS